MKIAVLNDNGTVIKSFDMTVRGPDNPFKNSGNVGYNVSEKINIDGTRYQFGANLVIVHSADLSDVEKARLLNQQFVARNGPTEAEEKARKLEEHKRAQEYDKENAQKTNSPVRETEEDRILRIVRAALSANATPVRDENGGEDAEEIEAEEIIPAPRKSAHSKVSDSYDRALQMTTIKNGAALPKKTEKEVVAVSRKGAAVVAPKGTITAEKKAGSRGVQLSVKYHGTRVIKGKQQNVVSTVASGNKSELWDVGVQNGYIQGDSASDIRANGGSPSHYFDQAVKSGQIEIVS